MPRARVTAIEVNGTYYGSQKPATFASWAKTAPDGFVFALKASRFCTNRKVLAESGDLIAKFVGQGIVELGDKLGPILWQFMATKKFDADDFAAFLKLLPASHEGVALRHAIQVRHDSFHVPEFVAMARAAGVSLVFADSAEYPAHCRRHRRFCLCRGWKRRSRACRPAIPPQNSIAGLRSHRPGRRAASPTACPMPRPSHPRRRRAIPSSSSSTARR